MPRIRWKTDYEDDGSVLWLGYLGKVIICKINSSYDLDFHPTRDGEIYTKLSSAKRGAERMLQKFMDDAGLEVKDA